MATEQEKREALRELVLQTARTVLVLTEAVTHSQMMGVPYDGERLNKVMRAWEELVRAERKVTAMPVDPMPSKVARLAGGDVVFGGAALDGVDVKVEMTSSVQPGIAPRTSSGEALQGIVDDAPTRPPADEEAQPFLEPEPRVSVDMSTPVYYTSRVPPGGQRIVAPTPADYEREGAGKLIVGHAWKPTPATEVPPGEDLSVCLTCKRPKREHAL